MKYKINQRAMNVLSAGTPIYAQEGGYCWQVVLESLVIVETNNFGYLVIALHNFYSNLQPQVAHCYRDYWVHRNTGTSSPMVWVWQHSGGLYFRFAIYVITAISNIVIKSHLWD